MFVDKLRRWLIISGIVLVFGYLAYKAHKYVIFKKSWRYTIYNKLEELECSLNIQPTSEQISFISKYIRLLNIRIHSRADCAALTGQDWIKWLNEHDPKHYNWGQHETLLLDLPYSQHLCNDSNSEILQMINALKVWLKN